MNILRPALWLAFLGLFLSGGCADSGAPGGRRHFEDESQVNVVLQFSSWEYTFIVRPPYQENGFLEPVKREKVAAAFDRLNVRRDLAVMVIGWTYDSANLSQVVADWKATLQGCGFRRAVFLRSNIYRKLNGSLIIDDTTFPASSNPAAAGDTPPK